MKSFGSLVLATCFLMPVASAADFQIRTKEDLVRVETELRNREILQRLGEKSGIKKDPLLTDISDEALKIILVESSIHHDVLIPVVGGAVALGAASKGVGPTKANLDATAALISASFLDSPAADGSYPLKVANIKTMMNAYGMCPAETKYASELAVAACGAVLVAPDIAVTAGHCAFGGAYHDLAFVFGFSKAADGSIPTSFAKDDVYFIKDEFDVTNTAFGQDWAVLRLDRSVVGHSYVDIRTSGEIAANDGVYVVSYPGGMAQTVSGFDTKGVLVTTVKDASDYDIFMTDIDTLERSSGSPVFNGSTHVLEGIFEHGDKWLNTGVCNMIMRCPPGDQTCANEEVTRIRCLPLAKDANGVLQIIGKSSQPCK